MQHPIADYIRSQHNRARTVINNRVECKIPSSDTVADRIVRAGEGQYVRAARLGLLLHSKREEIKGTPKAEALRRCALGIRLKPDDIHWLGNSWEAASADVVLGMGEGRVDKNEEKLLKLLSRKRGFVKQTQDYIFSRKTVADILTEMECPSPTT